VSTVDGVSESVVVDVMGVSNAGKTELIEKLLRELQALGIKVRFIQDQIRDAPMSDEIEKNIWAISQIKKLIVEAQTQDWDLIIVERGGGAIFASVDAFSRLKDFRNSKRSSINLAMNEALVLLKQYEDFFVVVETDPEVALHRDREKGQTTPGLFVNPSVLAALTRAYGRLKDKLVKSRLYVVDGNVDSRESPEECQEIREQLLSKLVSLVRPVCEPSET